MIPDMTVADFLDPPEFDVPGAVALGVVLLGSLPAGAPPSVRHPAHALRLVVLRLQMSWADRDAAPEIDLCRANARLGNAWMALHGALKAATRLPALRERSQLGAQLLLNVFPDGCEFLSQPIADRFSETARRLERIESDRAWRAISLATGHPEFLEVLKEAHETCCAATEGVETSQVDPASSLSAELQRFRALTSQYVLQLAAWCRQGGGPGEGLLRTTLGGLAAVLVANAPKHEAPPRARATRYPAVQRGNVQLLREVTPNTPIPEVA